MKEFKPTYLVVKWHPVDPSTRQDGKGLFYFCKTTKSYDKMLKYKGSGLRWSAHLKKYGNAYVENLWWKLFSERDELVRFALLFSEQQDIVKSKLWANEKPENGLSGGGDYWTGKKRPDQSERNKGNTYASGKKNPGAAKAQKGRKRPDIAAANKKRKGKKRPDVAKAMKERMKGNTYAKANKGRKRPDVAAANKKRKGKTWKLINGKRKYMEKESVMELSSKLK